MTCIAISNSILNLKSSKIKTYRYEPKIMFKLIEEYLQFFDVGEWF